MAFTPGRGPFSLSHSHLSFSLDLFGLNAKRGPPVRLCILHLHFRTWHSSFPQPICQCSLPLLTCERERMETGMRGWEGGGKGEGWPPFAVPSGSVRKWNKSQWRGGGCDGGRLAVPATVELRRRRRRAAGGSPERRTEERERERERGKPLGHPSFQAERKGPRPEV